MVRNRWIGLFFAVVIVCFAFPIQSAWAHDLAASAASEQEVSSQKATEVKTFAKGYYAISSHSKSLNLAVKNASWKKGAKLQLNKPSKSIGQTFRLTPVSGGYYRITMSMSGTAIAATDVRNNKAAARTAKAKNKAAQLWKPIVANGGIELVNKLTGGALTSSSLKKGANISLRPAAESAVQIWDIKRTSVQVKKFSNLKAIVRHVPKGGKRTVKLDAKGTGYKISKAKRRQLNSALRKVWARGDDASFIMVDLKSGMTLSVGPDRANHGASTFKAAFVTYIYQKHIEKGHKVSDSVRSLMWQTIRVSSNDAYEKLRQIYGTSGFKTWLKSIGLGSKANDPFPRLTARKLALVWTKIYSYEHSGGRHVKQWRTLFKNSYYSFIREQLSGKNKVYSKPGWYPKVGYYDALNDGAIVKDRRGRTYILAVLSNTNCGTDRPVMRNLVKAIDAIHREMP